MSKPTDDTCTILGVSPRALVRIAIESEAREARKAKRDEKARYRKADKRATRARKFERAAKRYSRGLK